ncbi:hypothetical protein QJU23_01125 [Pasteurella atlantica]|uniref:Uncharacterized protein n=2 Tax=Pasteurellaceae TaxID=712 RepID=A0ACC6HJN9_9PAST|nr:hypothetical protein [Pasteurella atlantica]MDP8051023.1 hypothetical protein [Pasteurella atlantica]MDP8104319.1 hypothetical protein [Pasteurella atlantica]MDP8147679.1 hypothetical protein [Pasteurella atlantica]
MKKLLAVGLLSLGLVGCIVPPKEYQFDKSRQYTQSFNEVWTKITKFYALNNIDIKSIEKASGIIVADVGTFDHTIASCKVIPFALDASSVGKLNTFVEKTQPITVTVNAKFSKTARMSDGATYPVECNSTGLLETQILDFIGK